MTPTALQALLAMEVAGRESVPGRDCSESRRTAAMREKRLRRRDFGSLRRILPRIEQEAMPGTDSFRSRYWLAGVSRQSHQLEHFLGIPTIDRILASSAGSPGSHPHAGGPLKTALQRISGPHSSILTHFEPKFRSVACTGRIHQVVPVPRTLPILGACTHGRTFTSWEVSITVGIASGAAGPCFMRFRAVESAVMLKFAQLSANMGAVAVWGVSGQTLREVSAKGNRCIR